MIILFSFLMGMAVVSYKKSQINYIDDLIFMGERIVLYLKSTVPETDIIFNKLQNEPRLNKYNIEEIYNYSPLPKASNSNITELFNVIGRFDADIQIKYTQEFIGYYRNLKRQYQEHFNTHCKLYIVFSLSVGTIISLMLI
ncbi:MAG: hypothetical protein ACI4XC_01020 [Eubacterium sp.]